MRDQRGFVEAKTRKLWKREEDEDEDEEDEEDERRVKRRTVFLLGNNKLLDLNFFLSFFLSLRIALSRSFFFSRERKEKERVFFFTLLAFL